MKSVAVVVPVYNEELDLPKNIPVLFDFLKIKLNNFNWKIIIVDNASTDNTPTLGKELANKDNRIKYIRLTKKGRGRALKKVWSESDSDILSYMDVDLSSDLNYFPKLVLALENGADISIGSRLAPGAKVFDRPFFREVLSRGYSFIFRALFWTSFRDAQCGFKAITRKASKMVLPLVKDTEWFFDSELLIIADKAGLNIEEVPIVWKDDPNSTVKVARTAFGDIKGILRLLMESPWKKIK